MCGCKSTSNENVVFRSPIGGLLKYTWRGRLVFHLKLSSEHLISPGQTMTMFGLFYFQDGSVRADNTSVIRDAYRNKKITVNCREDLESEQGWIEVIWPTQRRQQEAKPIAAKLLFVGGKSVPKR